MREHLVPFVALLAAVAASRGGGRLAL